MKTCPQCKADYDDDYVFCLTDGNALLDDSGEQETVVSGIRICRPFETEALVSCSSCGAANRPNSRFCKKCGGGIAESVSPIPGIAFQFDSYPQMSASQAEPSSQERVEHTVVFRPPLSPQSTGQLGGGNSIVSQSQILLFGFLVVALIIGAAIIFASSVGTNKGSNSTGTAAASSENTVVNGVNASPKSTDPRIGRSGYLITNSHIRSSSNRYAQDLGVHYQNATVRVLDVEEYPTNDDVAVWFRVQVIENGCDVEGYMGCGNDLNGTSGAAAMQGWMSGKNIALK